MSDALKEPEPQHHKRMTLCTKHIINILTIDTIDIKLRIAVFLFFGYIYIYFFLVYRFFFLKNILCCIERKPTSPKDKRTHELILKQLRQVIVPQLRTIN